MTSAQVVETSVNVISNSPSQDYTHPDDRTLLNDMSPGFKPFTILLNMGTKSAIKSVSEDKRKIPPRVFGVVQSSIRTENLEAIS